MPVVHSHRPFESALAEGSPNFSALPLRLRLMIGEFPKVFLNEYPTVSLMRIARVFTADSGESIEFEAVLGGDVQIYSGDCVKFGPYWVPCRDLEVSATRPYLVAKFKVPVNSRTLVVETIDKPQSTTNGDSNS